MKLKNGWPVLIVFVTMILSRVIPHPWNFTAVGAGSFLLPFCFSSKVEKHGKWQGLWSVSLSVAVVLCSLLVSDLALGFYEGVAYVYFASALCVVLGFVFQDQVAGVVDQQITAQKSWNVGAGQILGSLVFFFLTNFAMWTDSGLYPQTGAGLVACYVAAIPFLKWQILGDLFFLSALIFVFKLIRAKQSLPLNQLR